MSNGSAGYVSTFKIGSDPVTFTNEATTKRPGTTTANTEYRITDSTKRIIDPNTAIVVEVDADGGGAGGYVVASATTYTVSALDGTVVFTADQGSSALVRISGKYVPMATFLEASSCDITIGANLLDDTAFGGDGAHSMVYGLNELSGSASGFRSLLHRATALDATTAAAYMLLSRVEKVLEFTPVPGGRVYRAWIMFESQGEGTPEDDLLSSDLSFNCAPRPLTGRTEYAGFTIVHW